MKASARYCRRRCCRGERLVSLLPLLLLHHLLLLSTSRAFSPGKANTATERSPHLARPTMASPYVSPATPNNNDNDTAVSTAVRPPEQNELSVSQNIQRTLDPCVVLMKELVGRHAASWEDRGGIYSLAQGVVYWKPPDECSTALTQALAACDSHHHHNHYLHTYSPAEGVPELVRALQVKVAQENKLVHPPPAIMVTAGANQAYVNCVLTLLTSSSDDKAVVFRPYYFNHVMALQMTIAPDNILMGPTLLEDGRPDLDWLEEQFALYNGSNDSKNSGGGRGGSGRIQMVTLVNPGNPTGTALSRTQIQPLVDLCRRYNCWLVLDATYEYFVHHSNDDDNKNNNNSNSDSGKSDSGNFDGCFDEPHCIHIFSLSKSYALAGYRCGYLTVPCPKVYQQMLKVQDTILIAPPRSTQVVALAALAVGRYWVQKQVQTLSKGRNAILQALQPTCTAILGGSGAMYVMGQLPTIGRDNDDDGDDNNNNNIHRAVDDVWVANALVRDYGVAVIPGSFCGYPGWIRVCYANLPPALCLPAAERLGRGLREIAMLSSGRQYDNKSKHSST